jgi:hypothetical protein
VEPEVERQTVMALLRTQEVPDLQVQVLLEVEAVDLEVRGAQVLLQLALLVRLLFLVGVPVEMVAPMEIMVMRLRRARVADRSGGAEDGGPGFAGQMRLIYTVINITQPDGVGDTIDEDDPFTVTFTLTDSDAVVTADFYYDTDNSGFDGTAIAGCQDQAEGTGATCVWDTTGVAVGTYYVYAVVTGGTTQPSIYSSGQVTIQGAPVAAVVVDFATSTPGRIGGALSFDGGDDSVNGGDIDGGGSNVRTIAFWMKAATTTASQPLINIDDTDPDYIDTDSSSNITANSFTATSIYVDGTTASANIPDLEWHHVVVTVSGGLTADNFQAASTTEGRFGGSIDDVRVYNKVLSFDEIQRLYKLGATTKVATTLNTQPTLETGLVGHWTFDGRDINIGTNTIIDRSGQGHHGFTGFMDTGTTTVPGRIGQALSFPQSNDYVRANNVTFPTTDFTYALWAKRYRSGFNEPFFSVRDTSDNPEVQLRYDNFAGNYTQVRLNNATIIEGIQTPQNTWVHYAFTRSGSDVRLYIDGEFSSSGLDGVALAPSSACGIIFARQHDVDTCSDTPSGNFDGALDDARIYNRALSADEVSRLYKLGATTKISTTVNTQPTLEDGLVGHWTFDGPDVDLSQVTAEARDSSGQGNHGNWIDHATTTVPGRIGQALDFDGSDDYVAFTPLVETKGPNTKFTLSAWVYPKGWSATANTVFGASAFGWNYMSITDTTIRHEVTNNPPTFLHTKAYDFELNNWYHVATTYDYNADQSKLYVNGTEVSSKTGLIDLNTSKIGGIGWYTNGTGAGYQFNGIIDDARVYNRALSADEIQRLYKLGK